MTRNGDMNFGTVQGGDRVMLLNYGRDAWTKINQLSAGNLVVMLAFNQDIDKIEVRTTLDLLLAGDQTRKAVGWKGSENALYDLGHYRYRYDLSNIIGQVDSQPFFTMMPESAPLSAITVDNATLTEKAIL